MLTELYYALAMQLSDVEAPLYLADCVPSGTAFPYLTADPSFALSPGESGTLTLTLWCHGDTANTERFRLAEAISDCMPARGFRLSLKSGVCLLRLQAGPTPVRAREALGMKFVWTLRCYPAA